MDMLKKVGLAGLVLGIGALTLASIRPLDYKDALSFITNGRVGPYKCYYYFPSALENLPKSETKRNPGTKQNSGIYILKGEEGPLILCNYNWNSEDKSLDLVNFPFHGFKTNIRNPRGCSGDENIDVSLFDEEAKRDCQRIYQDFVRKKIEGGYVMTSAGKEIRLSIPSEHFTLCLNDLEGDSYVDEVLVFFDDWLIQRLNSAYQELRNRYP